MRLLLDAHISPAVGRALFLEGIDVVPLRDWRDGGFRHAMDDEILQAAATEGRVLVTFDNRSVQLLAKDWAESGQHHAGIVLVNRGTIRQNDIGGLVRALHALTRTAGERSWIDLVAFPQAVSPD